MIIRDAVEQLADSPLIDVFRLGFVVPDVIAMWAGEPDVPTPAFICDATAASLAAGETFYTHNRGIPLLRDALAAYHRRVHGAAVGDDRIALTPSGMNAVMLVAQALISPGDHAVVVTPGWPNVNRALRICGAEVAEVAMESGELGWTLDLDAVFAACTPRTRVIYTASPGNPTGWIMEEAQGRALLAFARARGIALLSDEVYHRIVYDRPVAFSFLHIAEPEDAVFIVNSFSKSWAMTGWRLGWLIYPTGCTAAFEKLIQFNTSGCAVFLQRGALEAVENGETFINEFVERCRGGREVVASRLARMQRVRAVPSAGGFYAMFEVAEMRDTLAFCKQAVLEARVGMAPGIAFGRGAERHVRLCTAKSPELLHTAMDRLGTFLDHYTEA
jgi:aspartate/methionine/tyrosine aminotransferase